MIDRERKRGAAHVYARRSSGMTVQDGLIPYSAQGEKVRDSTANSSHLQRDINIAPDPFYLASNFKDAS